MDQSGSVVSVEQSGSVVWRSPRQSVPGEGKAIVAMTFEGIEEALGLPEGVGLVALRVDVMCGVVEVRFDGLGLPLCAEGAEPMRFESLRDAWEHRYAL